MAEDRIDSYVNRTAVEEDTTFLLKQLNEVYDRFKKINNLKIELSGDKSISKIAASVSKLRNEIDATEKVQKEIDATFQKRMALDEQKNKILVEEKELLRQRNAEVKNSVREQNAAIGSIEQMRATLIRLNKEYDNLSESERTAATGQDLKTKINGLSSELKKLEGETGRFQRSVGNYSSATKVLEKTLIEVKDKMELLTKSGKGNTDAFKTLQKEYSVLNGVVNSQANGFVSMREEIKSNQVAIEQLSLTYGEDAQIVRDLIKTNGQLRDSFADLQATQKAVGSDTFAFDALLQGGQALVGIYSAAEGAAALFGENNEDLQQTMVKLQAAMALVQGVQATVNALQKEGALIQGIYAARTAFMTAATRVYTFVTGGATVAARAFNAALIATGAGAAIALIATAASAMGAFGDETDGSTQSLEDFNEELQFTNSLLQDQMDFLSFSNDVMIEKIKQRGGTEKEITDQTVEGLQKQKKAYLEYAKLLQENRDNVVFDTGDPNLKADKLNKLDQEIIANQKKSIAVDQQITLENEKFKTKVAEEGRNKAKKDSEDRLSRSKEYAEKERAAQFALLKLQIQDRIDSAKQESESGLIGLTGRIEARQRAFEQERVLAIAERDFIITNSKATNGERAVANEEFRQKEIALERKTSDDILAIQADFHAKEKALDEENKAGADQFISEETDRQVNSLEKIYESRLSAIESAALREQELNIAAYKAGEVSKEEYELKKLEIENKARRESLLQEIEHQQKILELMTLSPEAAAEAEQKLNDLKKQLRQDDLKDEEDAALKSAEKRIEIEEKKNEKLKELGEELKNTVFSFLDNGIVNEKNEIQAQVDALEEKKRVEIEVANQSITNAVDRAAAISVIEARAAAEKEQLERRKRKLDEEAARFNRAKNIAEIIQNGASAVVEALPNIPLSILVGGIAALQLVRAIAAPIPKFRYGKTDKYEGPAWVDDGGKPEAIIRESGEVEIGGNTPRLTYLKRNDIVLPDVKDLADMQLRMAIDHTGRLVNGYSQPTQQQPNYDKAFNRLGSRIENAIKNQPQPRFDRHGLKGWVRGSDSINFLNNYR